MTAITDQLHKDLTKFGLRVLSICKAHSDDNLPIELNFKNSYILLIGNAGNEMWESFSNSPEFNLVSNPLDSWSKRVLNEIATQYDAKAYFPSDGPPHLPFQRWAKRGGNLSQSPMGVLIHPEYGPWFAFRGALLIQGDFEVAAQANVDTCAECIDKPCLDACPVGAVTRTSNFAVDLCRDHVSISNSNCRNIGCAMRHACPVGKEYVYKKPQANFHMRSFAPIAK